MFPAKKRDPAPSCPAHRYMAGGFTLIELMVVAALLSIIAMVAVPRLSRFFSNRAENMSFLTKYIAKTHDDAFLNGRTNFLAIHLYKKEQEKTILSGGVFDRRNGVSVLNFRDNVYTDSTRRLLQHYEFPDSFRIEEVVLRTGEVVTSGSVVIPFYPQGYSDNAVIHVITGDDKKWSVNIRRHFRDPEVVNDWIR